ncbi:hypothetical protein jhhlp_004050 [Lomentospora prolificans]|uniref:Arb2 domain-containing protein n=1 Tax=Lomentospora prolificans TaxID=41688 RepID=A0A2N3NAG2_9PEZI|nr:hypothetical protein jhhlp_004050 [Lomentospora prolificans]
MFYRSWSGLPEDVDFPCDLRALGYFVNDEDEIRNIENPNTYFRYHIDILDRVNDRQRFAFNSAIEDIIHDRLKKEGLEKIRLPWDVEADKAHIPIFASSDIKTKSRVIIIFGETSQMLGALALRIVNGRGGIDKGSLVSIVRKIKDQHCSADDENSPGIILANLGQTFWWPEGKKALELGRWLSTPAPSMVQTYRILRHDVNLILGNEDHGRHVKYIFDEVLNVLVSPAAKVDIIGIGDGANAVVDFLDFGFSWAIFGPRLNSIVLLGGSHHVDMLRCDGFKRFLETRARAYIVEGSVAVNMPLSTHLGNGDYPGHTAFGCPVYSSGEPHYVECILPRAGDHILKWIQEVADKEDYINDPELVVAEFNKEDPKSADESADDGWVSVPEEEKPLVSFADAQALADEVRLLRMWDKFRKTGKFEPV